VDLVALAKDCARAQETDSGDDLGGDSRRVGRAAKDLEPQSRKQAGTNSHKPEGFDSGRVAVELALEPDGDRKDCGDEEAKREIDVV
jgi:hypothetical protein